MLEKEKTRTKKLYSVGYSRTLKSYVLCTIELGLLKYKRYFKITEAEYKCPVENLDIIASVCRKRGVSSWRYLCSDKSEENTKQQDETHKILSDGMVRFQYSKAQYF